MFQGCETQLTACFCFVESTDSEGLKLLTEDTARHAASLVAGSVMLREADHSVW